MGLAISIAINNESGYTEAIKAYQERLPKICTDDLIKEINTCVLKIPAFFGIRRGFNRFNELIAQGR